MLNTTVVSFLVLHTFVENALYVQYPPQTSESYVCFSAKKIEKWPDCYKSMKLVKINHNYPAFQHIINRTVLSCDEISYFKVLYLYPNRSVINSTWLQYGEICHKEISLVAIISSVISVIVCILIVIFLYFKSRRRNLC